MVYYKNTIEPYSVKQILQAQNFKVTKLLCGSL